MVQNLDFAPTFLEAAGIDVPTDMQGESLVPLANGTARTTPVRMEYAAEASYAPLVGLRQDQWKYIHCELDPPQLFDLENDIGETKNVADQNPDVVAKITQLVDKARAELGDSATKQTGTGVRPAGQLEAGDLRFNWVPGQPLDVEPK